MCTVGQEHGRGGTGCFTVPGGLLGLSPPKAELYKLIGNAVYQGPEAAAGSFSEGIAWSHDSHCL